MRVIFRSGEKNYESATKHKSNLNQRPVTERCLKISDPKTLDIGLKNKWNWNWLQERDLSENKDFLLDYVLKINKPGVVYCLYCDIDIVYGSLGKKKSL